MVPSCISALCCGGKSQRQQHTNTSTASKNIWIIKQGSHTGSHFYSRQSSIGICKQPQYSEQWCTEQMGGQHINTKKTCQCGNCFCNGGSSAPHLLSVLGLIGHHQHKHTKRKENFCKLINRKFARHGVEGRNPLHDNPCCHRYQRQCKPLSNVWYTQSQGSSCQQGCYKGKEFNMGTGGETQQQEA